MTSSEVAVGALPVGLQVRLTRGAVVPVVGAVDRVPAAVAQELHVHDLDGHYRPLHLRLKRRGGGGVRVDHRLGGARVVALDHADGVTEHHRLPRRCALSYMDNTTRCHGGRQGLLSTFPRIAVRPSDALSRRRRHSRALTLSRALRDAPSDAQALL